MFKKSSKKKGNKKVFNSSKAVLNAFAPVGPKITVKLRAEGTANYTGSFAVANCVSIGS
jgi:hypothetical protein